LLFYSNKADFTPAPAADSAAGIRYLSAEFLNGMF